MFVTTVYLDHKCNCKSCQTGQAYKKTKKKKHTRSHSCTSSLSVLLLSFCHKLFQALISTTPSSTLPALASWPLLCTVRPFNIFTASTSCIFTVKSASFLFTHTCILVLLQRLSLLLSPEHTSTCSIFSLQPPKLETPIWSHLSACPSMLQIRKGSDLWCNSTPTLKSSVTPTTPHLPHVLHHPHILVCHSWILI